MRVTIADNAGFCFGVKRAVDAALNEKDSYTLGPLIHNPQTIKKLEERGIKSVKTIDDIHEGTLLIRTHGVPGSLLKVAKEKGLNVVDLTCPFVKKAQDFAKDFYTKGYQVVIIGEADHPEVIGIKGNIENAVVVETPSGAEGLSFHDKMGVVVQTTQSKENMNKILHVLRAKCNELEIAETICSATMERQNLAKALAKKVDMMLVVGGKESANTKRLYDICSKLVQTKHIESQDELDMEWFKDKKVIGITAGASTSLATIEAIKEKIEMIS